MALYQKHRPQLFSTIIDQEPIVATITNQIKLNKATHAYLFSGPRGIGKTTTARILAKATNCAKRKDGEFEPCNDCVSCQEIIAGNSIDVVEIDAASHTGVDNVRENIIENAQFKPTKSKYKIFIIDEVHMLSTAAFNALLKTLEEPPKHVVFILATTETRKLPATIISRCQHFNFKKVPIATLKKYLFAIAKEESVKVDEVVLEYISKKSEGCVRDAVNLLDQLMASGDKKITAEQAQFILPSTNLESQLQFITYCVRAQVKAGLALIGTLVNNGVSLRQFATDLIEILRIILIYQVDPKLAANEMDISGKLKDELKSIADIIEPRILIDLIDTTMRRASEINSAPLPQLPLEMLIVEWSIKSTLIPNSTHANDSSSTIEAKEIPDKLPRSIASTVAPTETQMAELHKKTLTEKVKELVHPATVTKAEVENAWGNFLKQLEQKNPSLTFLLKLAKLKDVSHGTISIGVQYSFHQEKLSEKTCRQNLENLFKEILGHRVTVEIVLDQSEAAIKKQTAQELAAAFGGEIVG